MKKNLLIIFLGLFSIFIFGKEATAKEYLLTLVSTSGTSCATVASGTSDMYVNYSGVTYINLTDYKNPSFAVQLTSISGLTVEHITEMPKAGDNSGTTFTVRYKESLNSNLLPYATTTNVINGMAFSGNTLYEVQIFPNAMGYIAFEFVSGITPIGRADFVFKVIEDN